MSVTNNENLMTSIQVKKQLKSIDTEQPDMKNSLLDFIGQFQYLDKIAKSMGLIKKDFSFANRVSWDSVLSALAASENVENKLKDINEVISSSSKQLENEIIPQLQRIRNRWMLNVILIEFVILVFLGLVTAGLTHVLGIWNMSSISFSVQPLLYDRPIFSFLTFFVLLSCFFVMHFNIRNFVARQTVRELKKESSEFDLVGAFLKNTVFIHSIFRPDIVGFGWVNRNRLQMSQN